MLIYTAVHLLCVGWPCISCPRLLHFTLI